jgi:acyl-CoA synthetase (AMP-forming)/AMP-acid ligase II
MLSPQLKTSKLTYILNNCQAKGLIIHTDKLDIIRGHFNSVSSVKCVVVVGDKGKIVKLDAPEVLSWDEIENLKLAHSSLLTPYSSVPAPSALHPTPSAFNPEPCALRPVPSSNIDLDLATIIYTSRSTAELGSNVSHLNMTSAQRQ